MPVIASAKLPTVPHPTSPDVEDPITYRFSGIVMNKILDEYGNLVVVYPHKTQPMEYFRRRLLYSTVRIG